MFGFLPRESCLPWFLWTVPLVVARRRVARAIAGKTRGEYHGANENGADARHMRFLWEDAAFR